MQTIVASQYTAGMVEQRPRLEGRTVGERIRSAYILAGYNRSSFARRIDVHNTTIFSWEKGQKQISDANLEAVASATGYSENELRGREPSAAPPASGGTLYPAAFAAFQQQAAELCAARGWLPPTEAELAEVSQLRLGLRAGEEPSAEDFLDGLEMHRRISARRRTLGLVAQAGDKAAAEGAPRRKPRRK